MEELRARIDAMFNGEKVHITERRPVLHVALRLQKNASILVDANNVVPGPRGAQPDGELLIARAAGSGKATPANLSGTLSISVLADLISAR